MILFIVLILGAAVLFSLIPPSYSGTRRPIRRSTYRYPSDGEEPRSTRSPVNHPSARSNNSYDYDDDPPDYDRDIDDLDDDDDDND